MSTAPLVFRRKKIDRSIYEANRASSKCQELTINVGVHPVACECDRMHSTLTH